MEERIHAGYTIIQSIKLPNEEFVLGVKHSKFSTEYVTWCCVEKTKYYHGHYISNYDFAVIDLYERARISIEWKLRELKGGD